MIRVNLLPKEERPQRRVKARRLVLLFLAIVAPVSLVAGIAWAATTMQSFRQQIVVAEEKRAEYGALYDEVMSMERALTEVEEKLSSRQKLMTGLLDPSGILRPMETIIPENVTYASFRVGADRTVALNGSALDYYGVAALHLKLLSDPKYTRAVLQNATDVGYGVSFIMNFVLKEGVPIP